MIGRFRDGIFDTLGRHCFLACACRQILCDHDHPCGPASPPASSSIELFFDLVFVFVITQVTQLVEHAHGAMEFLRALLVLVPIWWMYAGRASGGSSGRIHRWCTGENCGRMLHT